MNIYEYLENYKTTPREELNKLLTIIKRKEYNFVGSICLEDFLNETFPNSVFGSHYPSFDSFFRKTIIGNDDSLGLPSNTFSTDSDENDMIRYRFFCEVLLGLFAFTKVTDPSTYSQYFNSIDQSIRMIDEGLSKMGYGLMEYGPKKKIVTYKKDIVAETVAASQDKELRELIFDYLISKSLKEKETALTALCIRLEKEKMDKGFPNSCREFIQYPRHKTEKQENPESSWFFESTHYEENLDKLFQLCIGFLSYQRSNQYLTEFQANKLKGKNDHK